MSTSTAIQGLTSPSALRRLVARHPVATFLLMAYTVSITLMFIRLQTEGNIQSPSYEYFVGFLEHLLSAAFPAFLVVAALQGKDGVRDLAKRGLRWRVGARWYIIPLFVISIASLLGASRALVLHRQQRAGCGCCSYCYLYPRSPLLYARCFSNSIKKKIA